LISSLGSYTDGGEAIAEFKQEGR